MGLEKKMKTGFSKLFVAVLLLTLVAPTLAATTIIATVVYSAIAYGAGVATSTIIATAITMVASAVLSKAFFNQQQASSGGSFGIAGSAPNPGNRQQVPPATDNKLPIVYGKAWLGGTITDLSITSNNQTLYYVMSICEVTNNGTDTITFGKVYWAGKLCNFADATSPNVVSLTDESTGVVDTSINGKLQIYLFRNGSNTPVRGTETAIQVMQSSGLTYTWDSTKLMTNTAFAIVKITYSVSAGITGIQNTGA